MLFHEELFTRSQCTNCQQEIQKMGIECVECHNGSFRLCVECFTLGAEVGQHKVEHKYRFFDLGSLVLNPNPTPETMGSDAPNWSAREETRLLDAIEQYGFGNWQDISKHIESKTPSEAKTHYVNRYVNGTLGQLTWSTGVTEVTRNICNTEIQKPIDHTIPCDEGPLSPSLTQRLPPLEISTDEMLQLGYMPNRDDYEKEFDNEAEKLVSQLIFTPDDEELDVGLKLALVDMYSRRLRERARRKRIARDYQLVAKFFRKDKVKTNGTSTTDATGNKGQTYAYEKSLQEKLRPFAQYLTSKECDNIVKNFGKEKELKYRLTELYKYRRNGIRRPEECAEYERLKGTGAVVKGKRLLDSIAEGENEEGRSGNKQVLLAESLVAPLLVRQLQQAIPPNSPKTKPSLSGVGSDESENASPSVGPSLTQPRFSSDDSSLKSSMESSGSVHASLPQVPGDEQKATQVQRRLTSESSFQQNEKLRALGDQYTAEYAPSSDLLTTTEVQFCSKTTITPAQFLTLKTAFLLARKPKMDNNQQTIELKDVPCPTNISLSIWEMVINFFKTNYV